MRRPLSFFIAGLFIVGCAGILELDGYDDAVTLLCQCPGFESIQDCIGAANKRLAFSSDVERSDWLAEFQEKQCGVLCDHADQCYADVPACREKRNGCECCSWNDGKLACTSGVCATCRTCSEIAAKPDQNNDCVTGRTLYRDVRQCGCIACSDKCAGFCQGTQGLTMNAADMCSTCLSVACSDLLTVCMADVP